MHAWQQRANPSGAALFACPLAALQVVQVGEAGPPTVARLVASEIARPKLSSGSSGGASPPGRHSLDDVDSDEDAVSPDEP